MKQIIGYAIDKESGIYCSNGEHQSEVPYLDFLLTPYKDCIKVFSDLDYDVSQLLALLRPEKKQLETLANTKRLYLAPYSLRYIPKKWFSIDKGFGGNHPYAGFSDMSQYDTNSSNTHTLDQYWSDTFAKSITAAIVGRQTYKSFIELGFNPNNLISPANVYRKERLDNLDLPSFDDIPVEAMELAYECVKGNWLEAYAIGHWDKIYDYDINSAYPYQASQLLDTRQGRWKQHKEYQANATYGYCKCEVMIDKEFSPIIKQYNEKNFTPKGVFITSLTKAEIDFIDKWQLGYTTILDAWWWFKNNAISESYPLITIIQQLYKEKQQATRIKREIIKRIMSGSFYGMFIELRNDEFGDHFFAPYAAEIESQTRLQIAEYCLANKIIPLHIAVDGIIVDRIMPSSPNFRLGEWRLECSGMSGIICSSGLVAIEDKNGKGDFSVSYDQLMNYIKQQPGATSYKMTKQEALTLAQAQNLGRIEDVGKIEEVSRTIQFGDAKREYEDSPKSFRELSTGHYVSRAWDAEMIAALEEIEEVKT